MGSSDVEMEDAVKHTHDSGDCVQESEDKLHDGRVKSKEENSPPATAVADDAHKSENGGENPLRNETEDKNSVNSEMESINPKREANEPINPEGESIEEIITKSENEELITAKTKVEEKVAIRSAAEDQTDAINEVVEQNPTNGGLNQENSTEKVMDGGNPVNLVMEEKPSEDSADKKPKEIGRKNADPEGYVAVEEKTTGITDNENDSSKNSQLSNKVSTNETHQSPKTYLDEVPQDEDEKMEDVAHLYEAKEVKDEIGQSKEIAVTDEIAAKHAGDDDSFQNQQEPVTPNSLVNFSSAKAGDNTGETVKTGYTQATLPLMAESDDGTLEEQAAFMKEVESFYRERAMDFKPPKFYGQPLNCLKLWRAVIRLGGYDRVTGAKLWRQVGESFHPPKTCTTVSWTFRIFYEKSLLEYERHKTQSGELQLPVATLPEASGVDGEGNGYQGSGPGRARRDAAARAMQGWHAQRHTGSGEVGEPIIKDKNLNNMAKREKTLKSIGSLKQKRPNDVEHSVKAARAETSKQLVTSVVDIGPPADWVKINVRQTKDCFEVYALVPGLLREEVRVQSDPAGRLVITGQPEQADNPWGITPFKKVVSLPGRIDPLQTSAVVSLHGRLFVRVPFEQSNM